MNNLNPVDKEFTDYLNDLNKRLYKLETNRQPYQGDWWEASDEITIVSTTPRVFSFTNGLNPKDLFSLGDPVRWKEDGGAYQYGYIFELTTVDFTVSNDNFSTSPSAVISNLARGVVRTPIGHPKRFHNQILQSNSDFTVSSGSVTAGKVGVDWWMDGAVLNIIGTTLGTGNQPITTSGAATFNITMRMPFLRLRNDPNVVGYVNISTPHPLIVNQGLEAHGQTNFTTQFSAGVFTLCLILQRTGLASWGSATYDIDCDLRGVPYNLT